MQSHLLRQAGRTVAPLAAVVLAASCVTSGGGQAEQQEGSSVGQVPKDTEATINLLMEGVPDTDVVQSLVSEFNEVYPDITVRIETLPYDQMRDKLVASFQAPEPTYDLIVVDNPWMTDFARAGFFAPLEGRIENTPDYDYQDFAPPLRQIGEVDDHIYGVPFYNYALGLIYREDLFAEAGLDEPTTLSDLQEDASRLDTGQRAGIAMQPQRGYKVFEEWANYLFAAGGSVYGTDGQPALDTPEAQQALRTYIDIYRDSAPDNSLNWAFDEALRAVSADQAAMMLSYNWMLPTLNDSDGPAGDLAGNYELSEVPGGKSVLGAWHWAVPANSAAPDAAWAFISWITAKETAQQRVIAGGAPVRMSVLESEEVWEQGYGPGYYETVAQLLSNSAPLCEGSRCEEMIQAVGTELNAAVAGQKSVAEALQAADEAATQIQEG